MTKNELTSVVGELYRSKTRHREKKTDLGRNDLRVRMPGNHSYNKSPGRPRAVVSPRTFRKVANSLV